MSYNRLGIGLGTGFPSGALDVHSKFVVLESGNVGIGKTDPSQPLDVIGNINLSSGSQISVNGTKIIDGTSLGSGVVGSSLTSVGTLSSLNVSGSVGIGTNNPSFPLTVGPSTTNYVRAQGGRIELLGGASNGDLRIISDVGYGNIGVANNMDLSFATNASERIRILSGGSVGIGTNAPDTGGYLLTVGSSNTRVRIGQSRVDLWNGYQASMIAEASQVVVGGTNNLSLVANSERMRITTDGRVGVGTGNPGEKLHIYDSTDSSIRLENGGSVPGSVSEIQFVEGGDSGIKLSYSSDQNKLLFVPRIVGVDSTPSISIDRQSGNVGVGTGSAGSLLTVNGDISFTGSLFQNGIPFSSGGGGEALPLGGIVRYPWTAPLPSGYLKCDGSEVSKTTYDLLYGIVLDNYGTPTNPANFVLPHIYDYLIKYSASGASIDYMPIGTIITLSWNVSPVPQGYLKCDGSDVSRSTYNALFLAIGTGYGSGDGSTTFTLPLFFNQWIKYQTTVVTGDITPWTPIEGGKVYSLGSVGIGTTNPDPEFRLQINGSIASTFGSALPRFIFAANDTGSTGSEFGGYIGRKYGPEGSMTQLYTFGNLTALESHAFNHADGTRLMTIKSNGNVGIGTLPTAKLHCFGLLRSEFNGQNMEIVGTDHAYMAFYPRGLLNGRKGYFGFPNSGSTDLELANTDTGSLRLATNGFARVFISGNGNVGIGHASPDNRLDIWAPIGEETFNETKLLNSNPVQSQIVVRSGPNSSYHGRLYIGNYYGVTGVYSAIQSSYIDNGSDSFNSLLINPRGGNVGIGTLGPMRGKLDVVGGVADGIFENSYYDYFAQNSGLWVNGQITAPVSIFASNSVIADTFAVISDSRIKKNIVQIEDGAALSKLRLIEPAEYNYIDQVIKTEKRVFGFIAQQVREHFPEAVNIHKDFIPDVYSLETIDVLSQRIITGKARAGKLRIITLKRPVVVVVENPEPNILQLPPGTIKDDEIQDGKVFVYGYEAEDFHTLNKEYLFTINFAATQELDRKVQTLETDNQSLKTENASLKTEVGGLRSELQALRDVLRDRGLID